MAEEQRECADKGAEIERLKAEIEEQRKIVESVRKLYAGLPERYDRLDEKCADLKELLTRAADALEDAFGSPVDPDYGIKGPVHELIEELRKNV